MSWGTFLSYLPVEHMPRILAYCTKHCNYCISCRQVSGKVETALYNPYTRAIKLYSLGSLSCIHKILLLRGQMLPLGLQTVLISSFSGMSGITQLFTTECMLSLFGCSFPCVDLISRRCPAGQRELVFSYVTLLSLPGTSCSVDTKYAFDDWMIDGHVMYQPVMLSTGKHVYFIFHWSCALTMCHLVMW